MMEATKGTRSTLPDEKSLSAFEILSGMLPDGVLLVGADGVVQGANDELARMLRYDVEEIVGQPLEQLMPIPVRTGHAATREAFFEAGATRAMGVGLDLRALRSDGTELPVDVSLRTVEMDGERVVVAAIRDLTAQQEAERTRATLEIVRRSTQSGVVVVDADGRIAAVNEAATRLLGVREADLMETPLEETLLGESEMVRDVLAGGFAGSHIEDLRVELNTAWGEVVPVGLTAHPVVTSRGEIAGVSMLLFDRSEQEASQASLQQIQARLEITERLGGLGSWELDTTTGELQMSPGLHELLGITPFEAEGTLDDLVGRLEPGLAARFLAAIDFCVDEGEPIELEGHLHPEVGRPRWITLGGGGDEVGLDARPGRLAGIVQDVSQQHEAMASLLAADRMKDEFLSTVSHELRTPLTVIVGFADYLREHADEVHAPYLEAMHRNASEMDLMVDQLLDLSRVQSGRIAFEPRPLRLSDLVTDALEYIATATRDHDLVDETSDVVVDADDMGFRRLLSNLVTNAVKFSPKGSTITISDELVGGEVVVSVCDRGIGIDDADLETIFEMFVQARAGRPTDVPGTGVGLTIVKRYVELHGGRVWAEPRDGGGTAFRFTIPASASSSHEDVST